jgi:hypothetical protein
MTPDEQLAADRIEVDKFEAEANRFYYLWFFIYLILGAGAIILPGLSAMGMTLGLGVDGPKYLAGLGALAAAIYGFFKPNDYVAAFDAAIAECRSLRNRLGRIPDAEKDQRMDVIVHLMSFKYDGTLSRLREQAAAAPPARP